MKNKTNQYLLIIFSILIIIIFLSFLVNIRLLSFHSFDRIFSEVIYQVKDRWMFNEIGDFDENILDIFIQKNEPIILTYHKAYFFNQNIWVQISPTNPESQYHAQSFEYKNNQGYFYIKNQAAPMNEQNGELLIYDFDLNVKLKQTPLEIKRTSPSMVSSKKKLLIIGRDNTNYLMPTANIRYGRQTYEIYDLEKDRYLGWKLLPKDWNYVHWTGTVDGTIYVIAKKIDDKSRPIETRQNDKDRLIYKFNDQNLLLEQVASADGRYFSFVSGISEKKGQIYSFGDGYHEKKDRRWHHSASPVIRTLDLNSGKITTLDINLKTPRHRATSILMNDGRFLVVGGENGFNQGKWLRTLEVVDVENKSVKQFVMKYRRGIGVHLANLPNGDVLIAGGEGDRFRGKGKAGVINAIEIFKASKVPR